MDIATWVQVGLLIVSFVGNLAQALKRRKLERAAGAIIQGVELYSSGSVQRENAAVKDFVTWRANENGVGSADGKSGPVFDLVTQVTERRDEGCEDSQCLSQP